MKSRLQHIDGFSLLSLSRSLGPNIAAIAIRPRTARVGRSRPCDGHDGRWVLQARTIEQGAASGAAREAPGPNRVDADASGEREGDICLLAPYVSQKEEFHRHGSVKSGLADVGSGFTL